MALLVTEAEVTTAWAGFASLPTAERTALIEAASGAVEDFCRQSFEAVEATERYDGSGTTRVWLKRRPVAAVASVVVNGEPLTSFDFNPQTGELFLGDGRAHVYFAPRFPVGRQNVEVTYTAGWPTIPAPVKRAAIMALRHLYDSTSKTGVMSSEKIGDYSYTLGSGESSSLTRKVQSLLAPYVRIDAL